MYSFSLLVGAACLLFFCYRRCLCKPIHRVPCNENAANTLLGDVPAIVKAVRRGQNLSGWLASVNVQLDSPIVQVFPRPLSKPWVVIADFREAQDILLRRYREFDRTPTIADAFGGVAPEFHFSFLSNDERLKEHRNLLKDLMTPAFLNQVAAPQIYGIASHLVELWSLKASHAKPHPFEVKEDTISFTTDSITTVAFGLDIQKSATAAQYQYMTTSSEFGYSLDANGAIEFKQRPNLPLYKAFSILLQSMTTAFRSPFPRQTHWCIRQLSSYRNAYRMKEELLKSQTEQGLAAIEKGDGTQRCALDSLLQRETTSAEKAGRRPDYYSTAVKDELLGFLLAGQETTASTLFWAWKFLAMKQNVQKMLRSNLHKEFSQALADGRSPSHDEIARANIPYLEATMEEIHRCGQILDILLRRTTVDTTILGYHIPKDTEIVLTTIGPGFQTPSFSISDEIRSESYRAAKSHVKDWGPGDVDGFEPNRWIKVDDKGDEYFDANSGPFLAFSLGPRGCFGRRLAYLQMRILLVLVVWNLELLEIEGELGGLESIEGLARQPKHVYIKASVI